MCVINPFDFTSIFCDLFYLQFLFPDAKTNSSKECHSTEMKECNDAEETSCQSQFKVSLSHCSSDFHIILYQ